MSSKPRRTQSQRAKSVPHSQGDEHEEAAGHRHARLEHILIVELQTRITGATDPLLDGVTVIAINLSHDAGHARVAFAVIGELCDERALHQRAKTGLLRATGFLRARLGEQLNLKKLPSLSFTFVGVIHRDGGAE